MDMTNRNNVLAALLLAVGIALAGLFLAWGVSNVRSPKPTVTVRGLAERDVVADLATWTIATETSGSELGETQRKSERDAQSVLEFLQQHGFQKDEIQTRGVSVNQYYDSSRGQMNITVRQRFLARTTDIARLQKAFADQAELIRRGVAFDGEMGGARYIFTKLNDVKPEMIAQATKSAREAADQFARDSKSQVGSISRASQGLFTITGRDGEYGDGGETPYQKVRVVTTVDFFLK